MRQKVFFQRLRICLFTLTLGVGFVLGLILPLRPAVSESEGRELTRFPRVTLASLLSGEFTAGISQWYADTYPCREELMGAFFGRSRRDRTLNLRFWRPTLYQLSYAPNGE